jgi:hypothetical protein
MLIQADYGMPQLFSLELCSISVLGGNYQFYVSPDSHECRLRRRYFLPGLWRINSDRVRYVCAFPLFFTRLEPINSALLVLYLLSLSSIALWFAFVRCPRFHHASTVVKVIVIVHAYLIIALAFAVLITAPSFGSAPSCNAEVLRDH